MPGVMDELVHVEGRGFGSLSFETLLEVDPAYGLGTFQCAPAVKNVKLPARGGETQIIEVLEGI